MRENLEKIIDTYGEQAQIDIAIEEMSELTKALLKYRRTKGNDAIVNNNVTEEMADVKIMLAQLEL
jgi:NTP pyrophosphatase (non-canonical NTP hydrolase)